MYQETFEVSGDRCRDLSFPVSYAEYWARGKSRESARLGQYLVLILSLIFTFSSALRKLQMGKSWESFLRVSLGNEKEI